MEEIRKTGVFGDMRCHSRITPVTIAQGRRPVGVFQEADIENGVHPAWHTALVGKGLQ
jgi:hypothetical protein